MKLIMFLDNNLIDSISLQEDIAAPGYIQNLVEQLKEKHQEILSDPNARAVFFIEHVPSSMNHSKKK
ncbi:MAG: hypothetical protein ACJ75B_19315 [Flavisolibacter sp.]|jgi:hypothetical protein